MQYDIILITGDPYIDHPLNGTAIIKRYLEKNRFTVGVIESPNWKSNKDFKKLGAPKLFFGVASGAMDSMVENYTPLKKDREEDKYSKFKKTKPDRAILVYCNRIKENYKDVPIVLGGIEASLRRFTHYDYWFNKLRGSILLNSRADVIAYGNAEHAVVEIANRLKENKDLKNIPGTCIKLKELPKNTIELPSHEEVTKDKLAFCKAQASFTITKNLAQKQREWYVVQYAQKDYSPNELDEIYEMPFTREVPKHLQYFKGMQFSVVTHRGCVGRCNFCSLTLHQGGKIVSRSEKSILKEITSLTKHKDFKGYIDDIGGPSANMYGLECKNLEASHKRLTKLLIKTREIKGVKKVFVRSGIRYDLAIKSEAYLSELINHHVSGTLKIAPEHCSSKVLALMNKASNTSLDKFMKLFNKLNKVNASIRFYFMTAHPGSTLKEAKELADFIKRYKNAEAVQIFTPTPMTNSTCMYYTGLNPITKEKVYVPYSYNEKKQQKNTIMDKINS